MKICKHQHRRGLLCVISLLLIAVTIAVLKIMMDLPGRIDALLLASRKCIIVSENETRKQDAASSFMVANATTSFVGNNEKYYHVDDNDDFIDDVIWNVFFEGSNDGSDKEEDFDRNHDTNQWSELHPACRSYRKLRARVRIKRFIVGIGWWHSCRFRLSELSFHSRPSTFTKWITSGQKYLQKPSPEVIKIESNKEMGNGDHFSVTTSDRSVGTQNMLVSYQRTIHEFFSLTRNVLRVKTKDVEPFILHDNHTNISESNISSLPSMTVNQMDFQWNSWKLPVVDISISGVQFNIVVENRPGFIGDLPLPTVLLGNMTLDEIIAILPKPPEKEGSYPRIGVVNVTNATVFFYTSSSSSSESKNMNFWARRGDKSIVNESRQTIKIANVSIPDEIFAPLMQATLGEHTVCVFMRYFIWIVWYFQLFKSRCFA
uniref:Uncharacterized protein n=1 Tax=Ditylum brightwellii TaxID=49249 RepID=A0A7S4QT57_9STRA